MIEITISRNRKVNRGNYESEDVFAAIKVTILDTDSIPKKMLELNEQVRAFVDKEAEELKPRRGAPSEEAKAAAERILKETGFGKTE